MAHNVCVNTCMSVNEGDQSVDSEDGVKVAVGEHLLLELGCLELDMRVAQASWGFH